MNDLKYIGISFIQLEDLSHYTIIIKNMLYSQMN